METVTVGCKLPHGLHLDVIGEKGRVRHTIKGTNSSAVIGGFGLTEVPKDFFDQWINDNKDLDCVKKNLVWAYLGRKGAESKALEMAEIRHGMEAMKQDKDPRSPRNVKPDDEEK